MGRRAPLANPATLNSPMGRAIAVGCSAEFIAYVTFVLAYFP